MKGSIPNSDDGFRSLVEQSPAVTYTAILEGETYSFLYISPQIEAILGLPVSAWMQDAGLFFKHIHPGDRNQLFDERIKSSSPLKHFGAEYRMLTRDNRIVWIRDEANVVGLLNDSALVFQGIMLDVTDRMQLVDELSVWDQEIKTLTENVPDIIARFDRQFRYLYLNHWFDPGVTLPVEQYLGKTNRLLGIPPAVAVQWDENLKLVFATNRPSVFEFSLSISQGQQFFETRLVPESHSGGLVETVLSVTRDLTARTKSEMALKESEERFRQLAESIKDVFWLFDTVSRRIVYVSPAFEREWGASSNDLYANPEAWLFLIHPEDRSEIKDRFEQRVCDGNFEAEYRFLRLDGKVRWIHERTFPIRTEHGEVLRIAGIAEDITERKKFEEERLRSSKLDSLGFLAGGLAHDFNNLLTSILGQLSLAKFSLSSNDLLFQRLTEAEKASLRAQDLTKQLLTFAKGGTPIKKAASLNQVVEENTRFVLAGSNVKCRFHLSKKIWTVEIDIGQISQVIQNLVINAQQAMPDGGELMVHGSNVVVDPEGNQSSLGLPIGKWVRVSFADQGIGIPKEDLSKIFDPYFTTKVTGTGLGLATSFSIVKNHGGLMSVDSERGVGTTFTIFLPASPYLEVLTDRKTANVRIGKGKILIMDDEGSIRNLLSEMVELCGYTYETAKDGAEALSLFSRAKENGLPFDGVILDLTIPGGMGGKDVIRRLIQIDPNINAIVLSGYSDDPVLANFREYGFKGRVSKPFRLAELSEKLHKLFEGVGS